MKMTFRWFGENSDTVTLKQIKQIPAMTGVMGFLDYKAAGETWNVPEIRDYIRSVNAAGLECRVIESVNVHEDIKLGLPTRDMYIENYIKTINNLSKLGVEIIVYNFMPIFDWLRTDLARVIPYDGSTSMYYDDALVQGLSPMDIVKNTLSNTNGFSFPGWEPERLAQLTEIFGKYSGVSPDDLRANWKYFLDAIIPICEKTGVKMACHPDDPAWDLFGLPRIAHSLSDYDKMVKLHDSPSNTICLCTGSLGSNPDNDIPAIIRHFGEMGRISCAHVRNVKHLGQRCFRESSHLSADGDLDMYGIMKAIHDTCPDIYIRPDHGRMIWDEKARPGYGLYDRALGAMYINGLWDAICRQEGN